MSRTLAFYMRCTYNKPRCLELSGFSSVSGPRAALVVLALLAPLAGCATVSVYEPASAEISLTKQQSDLHKASDAYCEATRKKGLAAGEASFGSLAGILTGTASDKNAYWRRIGADKTAPVTVANRIRADMTEAAKGLADLSRLARTMMGATQPAKSDVAQFERALIHARQARDSLSDAFTEVNKRAEAEYQIALELTPLDAAIATARSTADEMAAAKIDEAPAAAAAAD
jgi:hypothetical protein